MLSMSGNQRQFRKKHVLPVPDWNKRRIVIVDPVVWPYYTRGSCDLRQAYRDLLVAFNELSIDCRILSHEETPLDIWIRDWGFVDTNYFIYRPDYARHLYSRFAIGRARRGLNRRVELKPKNVSIALDGGNHVHNGEIAIVTDKVRRDNPSLSESEIRAGILNLGFTDVIIIEAEADDPLGHADGIVRFISSDQLLINDYSKTVFRNYGETLIRHLRATLHGVTMVPLPWFCTNKRLDGLWSAVGCYINMIITEQGIIYPSFRNDIDDVVAERLAEINGLNKRAVLANSLANLGGGLNCISLTF
jgi:agmatine/peptidylarginine deiminase